MTKAFPAIAMLAAAAAAHAAVIRAPEQYNTGAPGTGKIVPIFVDGTETDVQGIFIGLKIEAGRIENWLHKGTGDGETAEPTLLQGSLNPIDPPFISPDGLHLYADYSLAFGQTPVSLPGLAGYLVLDTTGLAPGIYSISLISEEFGDSSITTVSMSPYSLVDGSFVVVPEPAAGLLLLAGLPMLRRRRA